MLGPARDRWATLSVGDRVKLRVSFHAALKNPKHISALREAPLPAAHNRPDMVLRYFEAGGCHYMVVAAGTDEFLYDLWIGEEASAASPRQAAE